MASDSSVIDLTLAISKQLTKLRLANNLSEEYIAGKLGVTKKAYLLYESADRRPTLDSLLILADHYKVPIGYLVGTERLENSVTNPLILNDSGNPDPVLSAKALVSYLDKESASPEVIFNAFCDVFHLDHAERLFLKEYLRLLRHCHDQPE